MTGEDSRGTGLRHSCQRLDLAERLRRKSGAVRFRLARRQHQRNREPAGSALLKQPAALRVHERLGSVVRGEDHRTRRWSAKTIDRVVAPRDRQGLTAGAEDSPSSAQNAHRGRTIDSVAV